MITNLDKARRVVIPADVRESAGFEPAPATRRGLAAEELLAELPR